MIFITIIAVLILINLLLLRFSCDSGSSQKTGSKEKPRVNTPKIWSRQKADSESIFADK
ncbi:hypothetical protein [Psychroflexus aurantiacus]|uniref:hypothetical protein n=1 Tax=Psychroflexus aurantiacus TaxID=2709310 RepID=UPI001968410E|nr:hypothetical protein [Psychroflexus aurantiacus]